MAYRARALRVALGRPRVVSIVPEWDAGGRRFAPARGGIPAFDATRAWDDLERQCAMGPRAPGSEGHRLAAEWLLQELRPVADAVAVQRWRQRIFRGAGRGSIVPLTNILARIGQGTPAVMFATHWDTRPVAERDPNPARRHLPILGANDGASGVAVLLEVARALSRSAPRRSVVLAFFDGEDLGDHYYGSEAFAGEVRAGRADGWRAKQAVVVDMIGKRGVRFTTELQSVRMARDLWTRLEATAGEMGVPRLFGGPSAAINDDHIPLNRAGIPSVLLIDYAYPEWHTVDDTPERCDRRSLETVGNLLVAYASKVG